MLAMKLLSKTPKLNQLPKQRKTFISIFSSVPAFSTQVIWKEGKSGNKQCQSLYINHYDNHLSGVIMRKMTIVTGNKLLCKCQTLFSILLIHLIPIKTLQVGIILISTFSIGKLRYREVTDLPQNGLFQK